ncbi:MAG: mercury(II) reductase [Ignavibacteriae bacterium]|nr:mercury(II) reductase [Ignavibacteriota bacterium]
MARKDHIVMRVEGMTCDGCARHVTEALKSTKGVEEAQVGSWRSGQAVVIAESSVDEKDLMKAVKKAGYRAIVTERRGLDAERKVPPSDGAEYDLMIIGGGSAAFAGAIKAAELGAKVAIIESGTIGGTCVNVGCVPSKTLIRAAEDCYKRSYHDFEGPTICPQPEDWPRIVQMKDELVAELRREKYINVANVYPNISIIQGEARLTGERSLSMNGKSYTPGKILIATGSLPSAPPIAGLQESGFLDSTDALSLPELPESIMVVGGGAIGLEFAQLFARFGVRVMLFEGLRHLAPLEEPEIGEALKNYLEAEKVQVCTDIVIDRVERREGLYHLHGHVGKEEVSCSAAQLLMATGRRPNTDRLHLDVAGVKIGKRGEIIVNEQLQTLNPNIYAAGDVIGDPMFVYVTAYAGALAAENALNNSGRVYDLLALPRVTFTDPQIASVGLTEAQAREKGFDVKTSTIHAKDVPRAIAARDTRGLIKLVADGESGRLLGAHVLAVEAGDVIQEATLAIRFNLTYKDLIETFHPYLTWVEGIKLAAITFEKDVHQLSCCAA